MNETVGIVGAGAWGTALAQVLASSGHRALLWARSVELAAAIQRDRRNDAYLPGVDLHPALVATTDPAALDPCAALLLVTPAQAMRAVLGDLVRFLTTPRPLVLCAKGIEQASGRWLSEVAADVAPGWPVAILTGPTFADEVVRGLPTAVTLACADAGLGRALAGLLGSERFRPYWSDDPIGAQVGGAVKNVLAVACGVAQGRRLGENARAAVITRGYAEMRRFGLACGAQAETLAGLSGLGDLVLTCASTRSRNTSLGIAIGEGESLADVLAGRRTVAEGAHTAPILLQRADALGVDMPITRAVNAILYDHAPVDAAIAALLARPFRPEGE